MFSSLWLCEFGPQLMKAAQCYEFSIYNSPTQLKATACFPLQLAGLGSSPTKATATRTCAGVCFQIPPHASSVLTFCLLYPMQLSKRQAHLSPRILTLTSFFFSNFESSLFSCASSAQHFNYFKQEGNSGYVFQKSARNKSYYCLKMVQIPRYFPHWAILIMVFSRTMHRVAQRGVKENPDEQNKRISWHAAPVDSDLSSGGFFWSFLFVRLISTSRYLQDLFFLPLPPSRISAQRSKRAF